MILKLSNTGTIEWQKSLGGSGDDEGFARLTIDGGYIVTGFSSSNDGDVSGNHGVYDVWIVKLDSIGNIQWQKSLGGSGTDVCEYSQQTSDGGYIISGWSYSNDGDVMGNHGGSDVWVLKLSDIGDIQWQKSFGGSNSDYGVVISQTFDGGYILTGQTSSNDGDVLTSHGNNDAWVLKLNSSGTIVWQKSLGGSSDDVGLYIQQLSDGGYIFTGRTSSNDGDVTINHGNYDCWVVKLDSSGTIKWEKSFGGSSEEYSPRIEQTSDKGYVFVCRSYSNDGQVTGHHGSTDFSDCWVVKLSGDGDIEWQQSYGGSSDDFPGWITVTKDNGYIIAASSGSNDGDITGHDGGSDNLDVWIAKLLPDALLPVNLVNFSGNTQGKKNLLHWTTVAESNNVGFEVERSDDGINFGKIGFVITKSNRNNENGHVAYSFTDIDYSTLVNFYRLKQIDKDCKYSYSNIVILKQNQSVLSRLIGIFPNPVKNTLMVKASSQI